jgi:hypothetical protein
MTLHDPRASRAYRLRATVAADAYGDPVLSWEEPERTPLAKATVQAVTSTETDRPTGVRLTDARALFVPGVADLTAADRVEIDGEVWRVDGTPAVLRGLVSGVYTTASLVRVKVES